MSNTNHNRKRRASSDSCHDRMAKRRRICTVNVEAGTENAEESDIEEEKELKKHITVSKIKDLDLDEISVESMTQKTARRKRKQIDNNPELAVKDMMQNHGVSAYVAAAMVDRQHKHLDRIGNTKKPAPPSFASIFFQSANDLKKHEKIKQTIYKEELKWRITPQKQITLKINENTKKISILKTMAMQNIYLKSGKIATILSIKRNYNEAHKNQYGDIAQALVTRRS